MRNYDQALSDAKHRVTETLTRLASGDKNASLNNLARDIDALNEAWDGVTGALVRQRAVLKETIDDLHLKLAETRRNG